MFVLSVLCEWLDVEFKDENYNWQNGENQVEDKKPDEMIHSKDSIKVFSADEVKFSNVFCKQGRIFNEVSLRFLSSKLEITNLWSVISENLWSHAAIHHSLNISAQSFGHWTVLGQDKSSRHVDPDVIDKVERLFTILQQFLSGIVFKSIFKFLPFSVKLFNEH